MKTFVTTVGEDTVYDVVELALLARSGEILKFSALVVPLICNPLTSQPIDQCKQRYRHLMGLDLADGAEDDEVVRR